MFVKYFRQNALLFILMTFCSCGVTFGQHIGDLGDGTCNDNGHTRKCDGFNLVTLAGLPLQDMWHQKNFDKIEEQFRSWCTG